jgi:hypothetical protein
VAKKYQVSFDVGAKLISGKPMVDDAAQEIKLGSLLADHIAGAAAEKNVIKLYGWACKMSSGQSVELDSEDLPSLKSFVELLPRMPLFLKAQCLEILNDAKASE